MQKGFTRKWHCDKITVYVNKEGGSFEMKKMIIRITEIMSSAFAACGYDASYGTVTVSNGSVAMGAYASAVFLQ